MADKTEPLSEQGQYLKLEDYRESLQNLSLFWLLLKHDFVFLFFLEVEANFGGVGTR